MSEYGTDDWPALPPMSLLVNKIHNLDALELMRLLPARSVDMILIDPPYAVHEAEWDKPFDIPAFWSEAKRVIKPRHSIVITCVMRLAWQLIATNPDWFKYDMVMAKTVATDFLNAHNKPMRIHENILVFSDGATANGSDRLMVYYPQMQPGKAWRKYEYGATKANSVYGTAGRTVFVDGFRSRDGGRYPVTILPAKTPSITGNLHTNQKDVELFDYLIRSYTQPGDLILDCFAGSGTTAVAARNLKRNFIVGDTDAGYCEIARERLKTEFGSRKLGGDSDLSELPMFAESKAS